MKKLIRIVFVIFIVNEIDCFGSVCENCCDCFKEEIKEYEEISEEGNIAPKSLVNDDWYNSQNNLVLKIFKKKGNKDFLSKKNGDKISIKSDEKGNPKIVYQNLNNKKYAFFEIKTNTDKTVYLYCSDVESRMNFNNFIGIFEETTHVNISVIACDTEKVKNMKDMFHKCESLTKLDLKNFNTTNVTVMRGMFSNCSSLENLDLNNFNTTKVTDMGYMFFGCASLKNLDISNFNTTNVTDMGFMFGGCSSFPEKIRNNLNDVKAIIAFFKKDN